MADDCARFADLFFVLLFTFCFEKQTDFQTLIFRFLMAKITSFAFTTKILTKEQNEAKWCTSAQWIE